MNTRSAAFILLVAIPFSLAGCAYNSAMNGDVSTFGEANRQTMMAQVVDPDPSYEYPVHDSSAEHATQAIERYRTDKVKEPDSIRSTVSGSN